MDFTKTLSAARTYAAVAAGAFVFLALFRMSPAEGRREKGAVLFEAGRYGEAVRHYEEAVRQEPESVRLRSNLAHARAAFGQEAFLKGNLRDAGDLVDKALHTLPDEKSFHLLRARIFFEDGRLYDAMRHAERALDPAAESPGALELMGDIHYQRGELNSALSFWRRAASAGSGRAGSKIARAGIERDAEASFGRNVSIHFTLQYDGPVSAGISTLILREMENLYDRIGGIIGSYPDGDLPVILYSRILYHEITSSPLWAAGSFDGKIRVPVADVDDETDVAALRPVLAHEISHAFIRSVTPRGLPLWFEEGLAGHIEALHGGGRESAGFRSAGFPGSFSALDEGLRGGGSSVKSSYLAARGAVRHLIEYSGSWSLRRILEKVGRGVPFPDALLGETGLSVSVLEERLRGLP
jgi:Tfp pilus assembly protein PilF